LSERNCNEACIPLENIVKFIELVNHVKDGCTKGAKCPGNFVVSHGGGKRCQKEGCTKGAESPPIFVRSCGGKRCQERLYNGATSPTAFV